jgi:hypothetical protein
LPFFELGSEFTTEAHSAAEDCQQIDPVPCSSSSAKVAYILKKFVY